MNGAQWLAGLNVMECMFPAAPGADWQGAPGRSIRGPGGAWALNPAPSRWLLLAADDRWLAQARWAGALLFDTSGKWRVLQLLESHSALRAAVNVESILRDRDCAATLMFDTPVVMARADVDGMLLLCVPASYSAHLEVMIHAL